MTRREVRPKGSRSPQGQTARAREAMGAFGTSPNGDNKKP